MQFEYSIFAHFPNKDTIDYVGTFRNLEPVLDIGLVHLILDECIVVGGNQGPQMQYIRQGMDLLPHSMAKNGLQFISIQK